ncbi:hypothetical protein [Gimesia maris]|nr:hypothetical protein [Gimesia maris]
MSARGTSFGFTIKAQPVHTILLDLTTANGDENPEPLKTDHGQKEN